MAHLTNFSFEFFYEIFTEDASLSILYYGAKKSKMTKNPNQGGSCLNLVHVVPVALYHRLSSKLEHLWFFSVSAKASLRSPFIYWSHFFSLFLRPSNSVWASISLFADTGKLTQCSCRRLVYLLIEVFSFKHRVENRCPPKPPKTTAHWEFVKTASFKYRSFKF